MTINSPTVLPIDYLTAKTPKYVSVRLLAQLAKMSHQVSRDLRPNQCQYNKYFDRRIWTMRRFSVEQLIYADLLVLVTLPIGRNAEKYNKLLPWACSRFGALHITKHALTIDENCIPNTNSIHRAKSATWLGNYPCRFKVPKASSEDKRTLHETDLYKKKRTTSPRHENF